MKREKIFLNNKIIIYYLSLTLKKIKKGIESITDLKSKLFEN